jgi:hypothetical protein
MTFEAMEALLQEHVDAVAEMESAMLGRLRTADEVLAFVYGRLANVIALQAKFILRLDGNPTVEEMIGVCIGVIRSGSDQEHLDQPRIRAVMRQVREMAALVDLDDPA